VGKVKYLATFLASVVAAVAAEVVDVLMYDSASLVMTVTSPATDVPFCHGIKKAIQTLAVYTRKAGWFFNSWNIDGRESQGNNVVKSLMTHESTLCLFAYERVENHGIHL